MSTRNRMLLLATVGALLACASPALASRPHEFKEVFGESCIAEPCEKGQLKKPAGVAVNEATGDVYVVDKGANRVVRFNAVGEFQSELNGSGLLVGEEHAAGSLERPGEVETGRFEEPETIAVDNTCAVRKLPEPECKETDPSNGDVYVVDAGHFVIDKYSPAGEYLGQISEDDAGRFFRALDGVAVGLSGGVWAYQEGRGLTGYTNTTPNKFTTRTRLELPGFSLPGIAVNSKGDFYVRYGEVGASRIAKTSSSGAVLAPEVLSEESAAVATDQVSDNAAISNLTSIAVLSPEEALLERLGEEHGEKHLSESNGVGVNAGASAIYAADAAAGDVVLFGPSEPTAPQVEGESFAEVSSNIVKLEAQINPRSETNEAPTKYRFQFGRCAAASSCQQSGYEEVPGSAGQIAADFEVHAVSAKLEGLQPGATYHFRAIAENSHGEGPPGQEVTFTTEAGGGELVLADNRGWELVSPPDKQGAQIEPINGVVEAAAHGGAITYLANLPTETEPQGYANEVQVLSRREAVAWSSRDITIAHAGATGAPADGSTEYKLFDPELATGAVQPFGPFNPSLSEEASESTAFLHELSPACTSHCFHPLVTSKAGFANVEEGISFGEDERCEPTAQRQAAIFCGPKIFGASEDLRHAVLRSTVALKSGAGAGQLYEWSGGPLELVSVLPNEEPAPASSASLGSVGSGRAQGAVSSDGARVVWSTSAALYQRDTAHEKTVQLDKAEASCEEEAQCESGEGRFQLASADGARVFFTDVKRLSTTSGAELNKPDLYECKMLMQGEAPACELSDLTPKHGEEGADVQGAILGASEDGEYVYFVAGGVQSEAANARNEKAQAGKPNLYVRHGGQTSFIAMLSGGDKHDWAESLKNQPTRVSPDGRYLELMSQAPLTGYDNRERTSGQPAAEVYLYDAASKRLECASCEATGSRPVGVAYSSIEAGFGGIGVWEQSAQVAAIAPRWTANGDTGQIARYQPRYLADSGRLFFNSIGALVPQDANATQDVYEYEPPGVGDCSESLPTYSARSGNCVSLISSGRSAQPSGFLDASESGDDVYFLSSAQLSPLDVDTARDVYDAHVCTSSSPCITFPTTQSPPCNNESSCKASPTPQPSIFGAPASATFSGAGNLQPPPSSGAPVVVKAKAKTKPAKCKRGFVKKKGRCVKRHQAKKATRKGKK